MSSLNSNEHAEVFHALLAFLSRVPAVSSYGTVGQGFGSGRDDAGRWWVKFGLDIDHALAWSTVQELGHLLNYLSLDERLPTVFMPVSPPLYLNGGPQFLSWVIKCDDPGFTPDKAA